MTNLQIAIEKFNIAEVMFHEEFYKEFVDEEKLTKLGDDLIIARKELEDIKNSIEEVTPVEKSVKKSVTIEDIVNAMTEGYYIQEQEDTTITLSGGLHHDISITVCEDGSYNCETFCTGGIEHLKTYEWANFKNVKTLKGLKGYMRRYGYDFAI